MQPADFQRCYRMLPEPMLLVSAEGQVLAANPASGELFGCGPAELAGLTLQQFATQPEKLSRFLCLCQRTPDMLPGAVVIRRSDGSTVACRAEGALMAPHTSAGSAQILMRLLTQETTTERFLALNERIDALDKEIAERRRVQAVLASTNESLWRANADLEQFAYSASHDLREPLRMVALYSDLLRRRYLGQLDAQAAEYLHFTIEGARRMESLVADLLAYTQAATGNNEPVLAVAADTVLDCALSNLTGAIEDSRAVIRRDPLPKLLVYDVHLLQVFQNLIGNAIKYRAEQPPVIHISAENEQDRWRISVHDNGIGIAPEYADQVFGIFKRLHTSDAYSGTGVGLAICQKIVHRYSGRIWVESDGEGKGSTFHFTMPGAERFVQRSRS